MNIITHRSALCVSHNNLTGPYILSFSMHCGHCDVFVFSQVGQRCAALGDWARAGDHFNKCLDAYGVIYSENDKKVVHMRGLCQVN